MKELKTRIVIFENGTYFAGVKGKLVRKTVHFKDAKIFKELNDRDERYLESYKYTEADVKYTMEIL